MLRSSQTADDTGRRDGHRHGGCERDVLELKIVGQAVLAAGRDHNERGQLRASWLPITPRLTRPDQSASSLFGPVFISISVT